MLADFAPPARTVFEVTRLIPGWGLLGGLAADSLNFASDLAAIPNSENADLATGLIVFRNFVNIGNNGVGHILYVNQLIQDGLAGSVVGVEFKPLTAAANTALSTVKVVLDEVQMGTDIVIEVETLYQSNHAPTSAEAEQWRTLADGYAANILGDVVNLVLDVISLSSLGAANTAPIQQGRQPLTLAAAFMRNATPNIIAAVNGVLGVWLGNLVTEGRKAYVGSPTELNAQALALDAAGLIVDIEGPRARATYDGINIVVDALVAYADEQIAQVNVVAEALSGGKTAFQLIRDAVRDGLDDMNRKLGMVEQLAASATSAQANAASISAACASVLGALDGLVMPDVRVPTVELGEGIVAGAAEAVANEAVEAANAALRLAMASVSASLETAKDGIRGPVEAVQEQADALGEWMALLATECTAMIGMLNSHIASFSDGLGRCTNIEQVIDLVIGQISDLTGMPRVTVQEIRDAWSSVGPYIDQFAALGPRRHQRLRTCVPTPTCSSRAGNPRPPWTRHSPRRPHRRRLPTRTLPAWRPSRSRASPSQVRRGRRAGDGPHSGGRSCPATPGRASSPGRARMPAALAGGQPRRLTAAASGCARNQRGQGGPTLLARAVPTLSAVDTMRANSVEASTRRRKRVFRDMVRVLLWLHLDGSAGDTLGCPNEIVNYLSTITGRLTAPRGDAGDPHSRAPDPRRPDPGRARLPDDAVLRFGRRARTHPAIAPGAAPDVLAPGRSGRGADRAAGMDLARHLYCRSCRRRPDDA